MEQIMAKKLVVTETQKDGDIVIEALAEKEMVPVTDINGMILYWVEK